MAIMEGNQASLPAPRKFKFNLPERIETGMGALFLFIGFALMLSEVICRYFLHTSIFWAEELVRYVMLWAIFMGASLDVPTEGHIAVDFFTDLLKPTQQQLCKQFANICSLLFSAAMVVTGFNQVQTALEVGSKADSMLHTPMWIPFMLIPLGSIFISIRWIERIINYEAPEGWYKNPFTYVLLALGVVLVVALVSSTSLITFALLGMCILLIVGVPVSFAMGLASFAILMYMDAATLTTLGSKAYWSINSFTLLAIPFFLFAGNLVANTSLGTHIINLCVYALKKIRGGLGIATIAAAILFAIMTGSGVANVAALGVILVPMLVKEGYPKRMAAGMIACAGGIAVILPPNDIIVLYGAASGESIQQLFKAGTIPAALISIFFIAYVLFRARKDKIGIKTADNDIDDTFEIKELWRLFKKAFLALLMPLIVLGCIYTGITTPVEAASIATLYSLIVGVIIYRELTFAKIIETAKKSIKMAAMIYFIIMAASLFGYILTLDQVSQILLDFVLSSNMSPIVFLIILNLTIPLLGFFLGPAAMIVMITPVIVPIASALGINLIQLGILIILNMELDFIMPPLGTNLYVMASAAKMPVKEVIRGVLPFIVIMVVVEILIIFFPWFTTALL